MPTYLVAHFVRWFGTGTGFLSKRFKTCAALEDGGGEFARVRLTFADAHLECIYVQVSTAGGIALNASRNAKGFGAERGGGAEGQGI